MPSASELDFLQIASQVQHSISQGLFCGEGIEHPMLDGPFRNQVVLSAEDQANALEQRLFEQIREQTSQHIPALQRAAAAAAAVRLALS